jgi:anti-anti-sigma regulatory factor
MFSQNIVSPNCCGNAILEVKRQQIMDFKIDTRATYSIILLPNQPFDAIMAGKLLNTIRRLRQDGSENFILDFQLVHKLEYSAIEPLLMLHEQSYGSESSLVLTGLQSEVWDTLQEDDTDLHLNIAPTMQEAIDIINMEILERDILGEE